MGPIGDAFAGSVSGAVSGSVYWFHIIGWSIADFVRTHNLSGA